MIGPEIAVPLGLLVTEAITNAYKHAFNERSGGHIYVDVQRRSEATLELAVRDDGSGFDAAAGEDNTGLGRSLIDAFVRQLRGELEITGDAGTSLVVASLRQTWRRGHCARSRPDGCDCRRPRTAGRRGPVPHVESG